MFQFAPGSTQNTVYFRLRSATTGLPQTGLAASSSGAQAAYTRARGTATAIALVALATPADAWTAGGFLEVSATLGPGAYRLDLPDAASAVGVPYVLAHLGFTGVVAETLYVGLVTPLSDVGSGGSSYAVTVNNSSTGLPIAGARVWVSTDLAGSNVVAGALTTDAFGHVTFLLNTGAYYLWVADDGFTGTNPTAITVS